MSNFLSAATKLHFFRQKALNDRHKNAQKEGPIELAQIEAAARHYGIDLISICSKQKVTAKAMV